MSLGLSNNGENPDIGYTIFLGVRMRSCNVIENLDSISEYYLWTEMTNEDKHRLRFQELEVLDDRRLRA